MSAFVLLLATQAAQAPAPGPLVYEGRGSPGLNTRPFESMRTTRSRDGFFLELAYQFRW